MSDTLLLGIDVGTGSARAGLFTADGTQVGRGQQAIKTWQSTPKHVEQSSDDIWHAVCVAVRAALRESGAAPGAVRGIGFDATCSLVALDNVGRPVGVSVDGADERNVIVWMDHRATADAEAINATEHPVLDFVGGTISPEMQTPKLRWLKRELPQSWARTQHWFDLPDYLTWRATDNTDRSLCSTVCKWTYLGHQRRWDASYFSAIGLGDLVADNFARIGQSIRKPGERAGTLSTTAANELGLAPGISVAISLIDAHAGALGTLGATGSNAPMTQRLAIIAGTSACHLAVTREQLKVPGVWGPYYEALLPQHWLLEAGVSASGAFLDHILRSHPASRELSDIFKVVEQELHALIGQGVELESLTRDLHLQPHLLGNRAPLANPHLRGGVSGWNLRDDAQDLARWYLAALQALAYATRHIVEAMHDSGCQIELIVASGGSAANPRWCQIHADALGIPVAVSAQTDGVLLGAAMLGACASGVHESFEVAMKAMTRMGPVFMPNTATKEFHDRKYAIYRRMIDDQLAYDAMMRGADR